MKPYFLAALLALVSPLASGDTPHPLPDVTTATPPPLVFVVHGIESGSELSFDGVDFPKAVFDLPAVKRALADRLAKTPHASVLIKADKNVDFNLVTVLLDNCHELGVDSVTIQGGRWTSDPSPHLQAGLPASPPHAFDPKSFAVGFFACIATLVAIRFARLAWQRRQHSQHERELRRIASLDT